MPFVKGQSGNPAGRPRGSRNRKTLALEAALKAKAEEVAQAIIRHAMRGKPAAMRLCMEQIWPIHRDRPCPITLPPIKSAEDAQAATAEILAAMYEGTIRTDEAEGLLAAVERQLKIAAGKSARAPAVAAR